MEIKCDICGTVNDGSTNFCRGCFQKLDAERKQNVAPEADNSVVSVIEKEAEKEIPWNNDQEIEHVVPNPTPEVDNWEPTGVTGEAVKKVEEAPAPVETKPENELSFDKLPEVTQVETPMGEDNVAPVVATEEVPNNELTEVVAPIGDEPIGEQVNTEIQPMEEQVNTEIQPVEAPVSNQNTVEPLEEEIKVELNDDTNEIVEPIAELGEEQVATNNDDWSKDPIEEIDVTPKEPKYVLKFALIYLLSMIIIFGGLILTTKYLNKVFDNMTSDIVSFAIYRLAALFTLIGAAFLTFRKKVPPVEKMNNVTFKMLGFIAVPSILIQLFVLGFIKNTKVLMFIVGIMLSLIILVIFFSYIRKRIKKMNDMHIDDKVFFVYGIINIFIIIGLLGFGMYARSNDLNMPKINFLYDVFNNVEDDEEIIEKFVDQVQLRILENQETIENYQFPTEINDVNYAAYDEYQPDEISLKLNDQGGITGGTIKYRGITYSYDGEKVKVQ